LPVEIRRIHDESAAAFLRDSEREALRTLWNFSIVWHEQMHDVAATDEGRMIGAARVRIAASLGHVEALVVAPQQRRRGTGQRLLSALEEIANYYNCHKTTVEVPYRSEVQKFFERCGYKEEAVLPQHTWKRDVAVMRKFLL